MIKDTKSTKEEYKYKATVRYNAIFILQASFRRLNPFNKKKKKKKSLKTGIRINRKKSC